MNYFGLVQGEKVKHTGLRCIVFNEEEEVQKEQVYGSFIIEFGIKLVKVSFCSLVKDCVLPLKVCNCELDMESIVLN